MAYEVAKVVSQSSSVTFSLLKELVSYFNNKKNYIIHLEENLTKLTAAVVKIKSRMKQIDQKLEKSISVEKTDEYLMLQNQIEGFSIKYKEFITKYRKVCGDDSFANEAEIPDADASFGKKVIDALQDRKHTMWTFKFRKLAKLSKDVAELHQYVNQVSDSLKQENLIVDGIPEAVPMMDDIYDLPQFNEYVEEILTYLHGNGKRIGIWGPLGIGKTTVMTKLINRLQDTASLLPSQSCLRFEIIIRITLPKELNTTDAVIEMIQGEIMTWLKLEKTKSIDMNSQVISNFLCKKKYILFIDHVSSNINLVRVGIQKNHEFGKVVVASRTFKAINQMIDLKVEIKRLSPVDALDLFKKFWGETFFGEPLKQIAGKIIESCGGLPEVIKLVATYLKGNTDESFWIGVKQRLQNDPGSDLLGLAGVANAYIMLYKKLDENMRKCSLYGALFPSEVKIYKDYLIECWKAEEFYDKKSINNLTSARHDGVVVLNELRASYLLEFCSDSKYVKMPAYFRKVALKKICAEDGNAKIWVRERNELPEEETWSSATRISLIPCRLKSPESLEFNFPDDRTSEATAGMMNLPGCPMCSHICALLLQQNNDLVLLEDSFFKYMENLRVLDLYQTGIRSLPSSIYYLVNLMNLYLNDCPNLEVLPPEARYLRKLEVLDIRRASIKPWLPEEIGSMVCLRCLRVSFAEKSFNINSKAKATEESSPSYIISNLKQLEELVIETNSSQGWKHIADQLAISVANLEHITTLHFNFPSLHSLQKFLSSRVSQKNKGTDREINTFRSFKISVGSQEPQSLVTCVTSEERQLRIFSTDEDISLAKEVLRQTSGFELINHSSLKALSQFDLKDMGALKNCIIKRCSNLASIVEECSDTVLRTLEELHLSDLKSLQYIWRGETFPGSFSNLKVLTLCSCPELTQVLTPSLARSLSSLKELKVEDCPKILKIVTEETPDGTTTSTRADLSQVLHKVERIQLVNLPELQRVCDCTISIINWKSLMEIEIRRCGKLQYLSLTPDNARKLASIRCEKSWWNGTQLPNTANKHFSTTCRIFYLEDPPAPAGLEEGKASIQIISMDAKVWSNGCANPQNEIPTINTAAKEISQKHLENASSGRLKSCIPLRIGRTKPLR